MAEFPALPFWTDSYLADTRDLTAAQHGAYMLLLMTAWRTKENGLPDDDEKLARWAAMDRRTWLKNKSTIMAFWRMIDGLWHQKRLDDERKRAEYVRDCQVQAGRASALKRKKMRSTRDATEQPTPLQPPSTSPSTLSSKEDIPPIAPQNEKPKEKKNGKRQHKPTTFITDEFRGDFKSRSMAADLGLDFDREERKFIDHYLAKGESRADWQASFRTWLNHAAEFRKRDQERRPAGRQGSGGVVEATLRAIEIHNQGKD